MDFDTLVVAVAGPPRVGNVDQLAAVGGQGHDRRIHVPGGANRRIDHYRPHGLHGGKVLTHQPAGNIKIVDHHVTIEPAGDPDIVDRRRAGIAAEDRYHLDLADRPGLHLLPQPAKVRVEAPVEGQHKRHRVLREVIDDRLDTLDRQVDGLFAENGLAGAGRRLDLIGVDVGRRRDHHGIDIIPGQRLFQPQCLRAVLCGQCRRSIGHRIDNAHQFTAGMGGDIACVDFADTTGAELNNAHAISCLDVGGALHHHTKYIFCLFCK